VVSEEELRFWLDIELTADIVSLTMANPETEFAVRVMLGILCRLELLTREEGAIEVGIKDWVEADSNNCSQSGVVFEEHVVVVDVDRELVETEELIETGQNAVEQLSFSPLRFQPSPEFERVTTASDVSVKSESRIS